MKLKYVLFLTLIIAGVAFFYILKMQKKKTIEDKIEIIKSQIQLVLNDISKNKNNIERAKKAAIFFVKKISLKQKKILGFWDITMWDVQFEENLLRECLSINEKAPYLKEIKYAVTPYLNGNIELTVEDGQKIAKQMEKIIPIPFQLDLLGNKGIILRIPSVSEHFHEKIQDAIAGIAPISFRLVASKKIGLFLDSKQEIENLEAKGNGKYYNEYLVELKTRGYMLLSGKENKYLIWMNDQYNLSSFHFVDFSYDPIKRMTNFKLDEKGSIALEKLTSKYKKEQLAIIAFGKVIVAPTIQATIPNGAGTLMGFTEDESQKLEIMMLNLWKKMYYFEMLEINAFTNEYPITQNAISINIIFSDDKDFENRKNKILKIQQNKIFQINAFYSKNLKTSCRLRIETSLKISLNEWTKKIKSIFPNGNISVEKIISLK